MHWKETADVMDRIAALLQDGREAAVATVVRIEGSAYRRPGAKLLITDDGETLGGVSGGCLEADVREVAQEVMRSGVPSLRRYESRTEDDTLFGIGPGCDGMVEIFIQSAGRGALRDLVADLRAILRGNSPIVLVTVLDGPNPGSTLAVDEADSHGSLGSPEANQRGAQLARSSAVRPGVQTLGDRTVFVERLDPPRHLVVFGAGDDALPLVSYAAEAGFRVTVIDHRGAFLTAERFPAAYERIEARPEDEGVALPTGQGSLAVLMMHSLDHDRDWAGRVLRAGFGYVGLLGPRQRTQFILKSLSAEHDPRVFGPIGLDVAAEGPHQIAISILAELLVVVGSRSPRHLSERSAPIHA
jgi:xanthine dehydrogenase accessory factor